MTAGTREAPGADRGPRRLGVVGTLVWDTIHGRDPSRAGPVEEWGGIAYALSAFEAAGPEGWTAVPILKVGEDMRRRARAFLESLDRVDATGGVRFVDAPTNRVELRYRDAGRRTERLTGGVPGWSWSELEPLVASCDALYVNFIAGWEMELAAARRLRGSVPGLVWGDLHSLFLDVGPAGVRRRRRLERGADWARCFDFVQVNEDELRSLAGPDADPWEAARRAVTRLGARAVLVTRGARGARWVADGRLEEPGGLAAAATRDGGEVEVRAGEEPAAGHVEEPDPTGCGDVWGITCFGSLLAGLSIREAVRRANRTGAVNARLRGGRALADLRGEGRILETGEGT